MYDDYIEKKYEKPQEYEEMSIEKANEIVNQYSEISLDENGNKIRTIYMDDYYNIVPKEKASRKCVELLKKDN